MELNGMTLRIVGKKWGQKKCSFADSADFLKDEMGWALESSGINLTPMEWHEAETFDEMKKGWGFETSPVVALYDCNGDCEVIGGFAEFDAFVAKMAHA